MFCRLCNSALLIKLPELPKALWREGVNPELTRHFSINLIVYIVDSCIHEFYSCNKMQLSYLLITETKLNDFSIIALICIDRWPMKQKLIFDLADRQSLFSFVSLWVFPNSQHFPVTNLITLDFVFQIVYSPSPLFCFLQEL